MTLPAIVLSGNLASHARGRSLSATVGARPGDLPSIGVIVAFAKEFQDSEDHGRVWLTWAEVPGRLLILMPPFGKTVCERPVSWEARRVDPLAGAETELGRILARERQHELRGALLPLDRFGGQVVTAGWRKHPAAGLLAITTLPLGSLLTLDHRAESIAWFEALFAMAGEAPGSPDSVPVAEAFVPAPEEWSLLLHFAMGPYKDSSAAMDALAASDLFVMGAPQASAARVRLEGRGLVQGGVLMPQGEALLREGPYATYYRELRRIPHG